MTERPYQSEVTAELRAAAEQRRAQMVADAAVAGVLTDDQLDNFERQMVEKPARGEAYFPVSVLLMRHIRALEDK